MNKASDNLLIHDHSELDKLLEEVFAGLQKGDQSRAFARLDYFWARLAMHIRAEHLHLFPALLKRNSRVNEKRTANASLIESLIDQLREDHNFFMSELTEAMKTMRLIVGDDNSGSLLDPIEVKMRLENVSHRLTIHNDIEEARVYPLAESVLSPDEVAEIRGRIKKELDRLPPRFFRGVRN